MKYEVTFNWYGEIHKIYLHAKREGSARQLALRRLANKMDRNLNSVRSMYYKDKGNMTIKELPGRQ